MIAMLAWVLCRCDSHLCCRYPYWLGTESELSSGDDVLI